MDIKTLEKEALRKGYYLTKIKADSKALISYYEQLTQPTVLAVVASETKISPSTIVRILTALDAELIKSGKSTIVMPPEKKE